MSDNIQVGDTVVLYDHHHSADFEGVVVKQNGALWAYKDFDTDHARGLHISFYRLVSHTPKYRPGGYVGSGHGYSRGFDYLRLSGLGALVPEVVEQPEVATDDKPDWHDAKVIMGRAGVRAYPEYLTRVGTLHLFRAPDGTGFHAKEVRLCHVIIDAEGRNVEAEQQREAHQKSIEMHRKSADNLRKRAEMAEAWRDDAEAEREDYRGRFQAAEARVRIAEQNLADVAAASMTEQDKAARKVKKLKRQRNKAREGNAVYVGLGEYDRGRREAQTEFADWAREQAQQGGAWRSCLEWVADEAERRAGGQS